MSSQLSKQSVQRNSAGVAMHPGKGRFSNRLYCGAHVGRAVLPGSDGRCGPTNGPQCSACVSAQRGNNPLMPRNRAGQIMELSGGLMYCGRYLGKRAIPGSDGFCGPTGGPQCADCQAGPVRNNIYCSLPSRLTSRQQVQRNSAGASMHSGKGRFSNRLYCGAHVGRAGLPGSDGRCGPTNGPQCSDCVTAQRRLNPSTPRNRAGQIMELSGGLMYCGRYLGLRVIPGSDGFCGPTDGPQCADCRACSRAPASTSPPTPRLQPPSPQQPLLPVPVSRPSAPLRDVGNVQSQSIHEELENVKRENTCKVCLDEQINSVFIPCGHLACCMGCARELQSKECPLCRASIVSIVETFRT